MTAMTLTHHEADAQSQRYYNFAEFYNEYAGSTEQTVRELNPDLAPLALTGIKQAMLSIAFYEAAQEVYGNLPCHPRVTLAISAVSLPVFGIMAYAVRHSLDVNPLITLPVICLSIAGGIGVLGSSRELVRAYLDKTNIKGQILYMYDPDPVLTRAAGSKEVYELAQRNLSNRVALYKEHCLTLQS